ncbi:putative malate dehydrogenase 1B isoform X2 [Mugil cephalus]|uniref:putative malate dehydrogenase 1B isoform X2 n=1 Tax=Mugil cephalus TaxID=48193 RepID=UPI001FB7F484|nr:putative malate dehydrogenase 1B isoform X2 [Mugil cephalus]
MPNLCFRRLPHGLKYAWDTWFPSNERFPHKMAKFVLAGKTDCPHYAKAELLADTLQRALPDFSTHKISILPEEWKEWLEATCKRNGWKHEHSPLVWRELVDQGGKGMILGGFSDFLEHCQEYYGVTSDMSTEVMLSVAAENLEAKVNLIEEERRRVSLIRPLRIWITGWVCLEDERGPTRERVSADGFVFPSALSPTSHILIPSLLSPETFPGVSAISLHLLDVEGSEEELQGMRMETEDLAPSMLHQVTVHTGVEQAFLEAGIILLLDDGAVKCNNEEEKKKKVKGISERYREYGQLIDTRAKKDVKVVVCGDAFVNLRCSLLMSNAASIDNCQFVATATQLENEARAVIAKKMKVRASDITDVIVWGNISGSFYIDLQRAKVFNYDGPIKGPGLFSQSLLKVFHDRNWLETDLQHLVRSQRVDVTSKTGRAAATSAANGILTVLKAWSGTGDPQEIRSVGVSCPGHFSVPDSVTLSVPVTFMDGKWRVASDVTVRDELKERLQVSFSELQQEKDLGSEAA